MGWMDSLVLAIAGLLLFGLAWLLWCALKDISPIGFTDRRIGKALIASTVVLALFLLAAAAFADVPPSARQYRSLLTRTAHAEMGLDAPVATFAAQITQESAWNPTAKSWVGAAGLAQFMPATARWMGDIDKRLAPAKVYNPGWAMRAMIVYDAWLLARISAVDSCNRWAFALSACNGGLGWVYRDRAKAAANGLDKRVYWQQVELINAGRSAANFAQNRDYSVRILKHFEPQYVAAGWGTGVCETGS